MTQITLNPFATGLVATTTSGGTTTGGVQVIDVTTKISDSASPRDNGPYVVQRPGTVDKPLQTGDHLIMLCGLSNEGGQDTITVPSGWASIDRAGFGNAVQLGVWHHVITDLTSEPTNYSWGPWNNPSAPNLGIASAVLICIALRGVDAGVDQHTLVTHSNTGTTPQAHTSNAATLTTTTDTYVITTWAMPAASSTVGRPSAPTGTNELYFNERVAVNSVMVYVVGERVQTPGPLTARSVTTSSLTYDTIATIAIPVTPVTINRGLGRGPMRGVLRGVVRGSS